MKIQIICSVGLVLLLVSMAAAQKVYVDYNHGTDFKRFKTYAWGQGQHPNSIQDSIMLQNVQQEINSQVSGKGLQMVQENQSPDLIVVLSIGMKQQTSYEAWGTGDGWRMGGGTGQITPETSNVGTLVVDLYDANAKRMVWRGMAQDTLSSKSSKNEKQVSKAIDKMFKQYPKLGI